MVPAGKGQKVRHHNDLLCAAIDELESLLAADHIGGSCTLTAQKASDGTRQCDQITAQAC